MLARKFANLVGEGVGLYAYVYSNLMLYTVCCYPL